MASELWNLFYLGFTLLMMAASYYSRHEYVQKLSVLILLSFIGFHITNETQYELLNNYAIDFAGLCYALWLLYESEWKEPTTVIIAVICGTTIGLHHAWGHGGLSHQIAYNMIYLTQLIVLIRYGIQYGKQERALGDDRTDPFYRAMIACHLKH